MAKRESTYTQRSFFSRGKAWSVDARRPFVSGASRTRNALASHGHRSRLPLTGRIAPRLYLSFSLLPPLSLSLSLCTFYTRILAYTYTLARQRARATPRWSPMAPALPTFQNGILAQQEQNSNISERTLRSQKTREMTVSKFETLLQRYCERYLFHMVHTH